MLYICDRSTADLNEDDELNWTELMLYIIRRMWPYLPWSGTPFTNIV